MRLSKSETSMAMKTFPNYENFDHESEAFSNLMLLMKQQLLQANVGKTKYLKKHNRQNFIAKKGKPFETNTRKELMESS